LRGWKLLVALPAQKQVPVLETARSKKLASDILPPVVAPTTVRYS
jgi:hypothetical protein